MPRTQIYFEEDLFTQVKKAARKTDQSVSSYIREVLKQDLKAKNESVEQPDFTQFSGLWENCDITQIDIRSKAWK